jgi:hypothetical protein
MASKTRYPELMYRQAFPGVWRFVGDGCDIGPQYPTKAELLADLDRFAAEYGCDGALDEASALRTRVAKLEEALREIIHESEHTPHSWKERADRNAETARAALKGE